jgi:hypothetical protein
MTQAWFIDALDARGGLAFTSRRPADLLTDDPVLDAPCVFVGPPIFRPEMVSNRSIGFAATRGSFQLGLFLREAEVAFPSLEDVVEFVRRAYLRGGGGDAAGGAGSGVPPRPEGEPKGGEPLEPERILGTEGGEGKTILDTLLKDADVLEREAGLLKYKKDVPFETRRFKPSFSTPGHAPADGKNILTVGALELILELIRRFPVKGSDEQIMFWWDSAERLGRAVAAIGLWPTLLESPARSILGVAGKNLREDLPETLAQDLEPLWYWGDDSWTIFALLGQCGNIGWGCHPRHMEEFLYALRRNGWVSTGAHERRTDPVDDLASWPLSRDMASLVGGPPSASASLHDLLCAVIGSPSVLISNPQSKSGTGLRKRAGAIVVFAAMHICEAATPVLKPTPFPSLLSQAALARAVNTALAWLAEQFPSRVFPEPVENLIRDTSALQYA